MESMRMHGALIVALSLSWCFVEQHAQDLSRCGKTEYTVSEGCISSPRFPHAYNHYLNCTYNLRSTGQTSLTISYETIDLEFHAGTGCSDDWVEISCSPNFNIRERMCRLGETRAISYPRCSHAVIHFRSDGAQPGTGFNFSYAFQSINLADVRLNGTRSSNSREGRLEINFNETWGTVCDRGFTNASARVACASLGYGYVGTVTKTRHGSGSGPIWFDEVSCIGTEQGIEECSHSAWGSHNCSHSEDISINCALGIRLNNTRSSNPHEGRLEVNYNGNWGTVCDGKYTNANARVACASLGFGYVGAFIGNHHGAGTGPIWLDHVSCAGTEYEIDECSHRAFGLHNSYCSHNNDVSINCSTPSCGKTEFNDAIGFISSPAFPYTYGSNLNCTYSIKRSDQDSVTIMFPVFYIYDRNPEHRYSFGHCSYNVWVEVQCADEWHKPNIRIYCGYERPPALEFKSCDHVILRFHINVEKLEVAFQVNYGFKPATPNEEIFAYSGLKNYYNRNNIGQSVTCPGSSRQCNSSSLSCSNRGLCCEIHSTSDQYCMCQVGFGGRRCEESNAERRQEPFEVIGKRSATPWILLSVFAALVGLIILTVIAVMIYKSCKSKESRYSAAYHRQSS